MPGEVSKSEGSQLAPAFDKAINHTGSTALDQPAPQPKPSDKPDYDPKTPSVEDIVRALTPVPGKHR